MGTTTGGFGQGAQLQCTAKSKRSGQRCRGPAVAGSATQKCRMHGGTAAVGANSPAFKNGRHSPYLPANLDRMYQEARNNPELLDMSDHMAAMEARINHVLQQMQDGDPVPQWSDVQGMFENLAAAIAGGDKEEIDANMQLVADALQAGAQWDTGWHQVVATTEQLRKLADTEIKRKKELNLMVPVDRVITLMAAVGAAVKRNVSNPVEIAKVYAEMAILQGGNRAPGNALMRIGADPEVIDAQVVDSDMGTVFDFGSDSEVDADV